MGYAGFQRHPGYQRTYATVASKDVNGGYVGRDASGNVTIPGLVTFGSLASSDTTHTGKLELTPGTPADFAGSIQAGNFGLFFDSANGNKLTRRSSAGVNTVIEGS